MDAFNRYLGQARSLIMEGRRPDGLGRLCISECCNVVY